MLKAFIFCLIICAANVIRGETILDVDGPLILYDLDRMPGKYVFCSNYGKPGNDKISNVVIGDTFGVRPYGGMCLVVMTNAYILHVKYSPSPTNDLGQYHARIDIYVDTFPGDAKVIFNNSVYPLSNFDPSKIEEFNKTNVAGATVYGGKPTLDEFKKMGVDTNNVDSH